MPTEQEKQMFEQLHSKPPLKRPTHPSARSPHPSQPQDSSAQVNQVRQQSQSAIATASKGIIGSSGESLQKLDQQLSSFEDRYVHTVQQRIAEVPRRIEAKLAAALTWGQEGIDPLDALFAELDAWDVAEVSSIDQFLFGSGAIASYKCRFVMKPKGGMSIARRLKSSDGRWIC